MSIASEKRQRNKTQRRTVSGRWIPVAQEPLPSWHELVRAPEKVKPVERKGEFYQHPVVRDEDLPEVEHPFSGMPRAERRVRLRGTGLLGEYTRELQRTQGEAWSQNLEAKRLMRERARAERLAKKYANVDAAAS